MISSDKSPKNRTCDIYRKRHAMGFVKKPSNHCPVVKNRRGEIQLKRDHRIDVLRGVGLLCIVLAHVGPPAILFQIRNFDVPLMVLVAGSAFAISKQTRPKSGYIEHIKNRFIRLVVPTWIFLVAFFTITLIASVLMYKPYPFTKHQIIESFLFLYGIGYVWIIRVFLLVSLIAPFTLFCGEFNDNVLKKTLIAIFVVYTIYEVLVQYIPNSNQILLKIFLNDILYMAIPYSCLFFLGTRLHTISGTKLLITSFIILLVFVVYAAVLYELNGHIIPTQNYKYPPTIYYFLYAMFASIGLYWFFQTDICSHFPGKNFLAFLGRSSMWVYLWHIMILYLIGWSHISINFAFKYIIVLGSAVGMAMLQMVILKEVLVHIDSKKTKTILKAVFSG